MTAIIGIRTPEGVLVAGDGLASDETTVVTFANPKTFNLSPRVAVGYSTSYRMGQLLRFLKLPPYPPGMDEWEWLVTKVVPVVRRTLKEGGFAREQDSQESGGYFVVAVRRRLFVVESSYQVDEPAAPYAAVGSGEAVCLGALYALTQGRTPETLEEAERIAYAALDAAVEHTPWVRLPYTKVTTR